MVGLQCLETLFTMNEGFRGTFDEFPEKSVAFEKKEGAPEKKRVQKGSSFNYIARILNRVVSL